MRYAFHPKAIANILCSVRLCIATIEKWFVLHLTNRIYSPASLRYDHAFYSIRALCAHMEMNLTDENETYRK